MEKKKINLANLNKKEWNRNQNMIRVWNKLRICLTTQWMFMMNKIIKDILILHLKKVIVKNM